MNLVWIESSWLWLFLLVPLVWFLPRRATNRSHAAIRSMVAILLIVALARPALLTSQDDPHHVIVWDRSESVRADATTAVEGLVERLPERSRTQVITLNGARKNVSQVVRFEPENLSGSSMSRALALGARLIPEGSDAAITVVSDGMATDPQWGDAVRQLVERKIPVHTVTVTAPDTEVYPSAIRTRPPFRVGQTTKLMVDVVGSADQVVVSLFSGEELLARSAPFACAGSTAVELEFEPSRAGLLEVVANVHVVSGSDIDSDNNQFMSTLAVQEPIRALYLSERLTNSRDKMSGLVGPGVDLSEPSLAHLKELAKNPRGISAYDLVVIDDRPAETIPRPVQEAIVNAVKEEGVGLFYAGGKGVFGTGGYFDTPVASVLPVEMIQKEEKRDPSTTLVVIIDTSGSMGGERVQLAKECARLAIRRLLPHDKVGIVEFYGTKQWAAPIQSAANAIDIQRAINRLDAGGGTVILPAIEEAFYALQNVQTRYKHVLVLTDGGVESGDFESLMRRMAAKGINVSTVLVGGRAHSEFLVNLANWGKGHFYSASSRFSIPEVLLKQPSTSKIPPYRPGSHLVSMGGPSGWWGDIPRPEEPKLAGYVETRLRPGAQVAVETETERHPVLASWRYGLGRVSAFTTEPVGGGTAPWQDWDGYGAWLLRVLSRTSREHPQPFAYTIQRGRNDARIVAQRLTPQPYRPQAERLHDDGTPQRLVFQQRSPDVFTATVLEDPEQTIHLRAGAEGWPGSMAHLASPAWHAVAPETNVDTARAVDLALLASATGGQNVSLENISDLDPATGGMGTAQDLYRLWPWCLILGLLVYLGDLLFRRWPGSGAVGMNKLARRGSPDPVETGDRRSPPRLETFGRAGGSVGRPATAGAGGSVGRPATARFGLLLLMIGFGFVSTSDVCAEVSPALEAQLQAALQEDPFEVDDGQLYRAALLEYEALEPLFSRLDEVILDDMNAFEPLWLAASLQWRYGNLDQALMLFERAAAIRAEPLVLFRVAQLLDADGKTAEAVEQYLKTLEAKPDEDLAERIQLRLALLKSTGTELEQVEVDLAAYAKGRDQAFQNRAGVVLALAGKPKEALALYKPAKDGNQRFKQLIRIAEWAMAAEDMARAQASAWDALQSAKLRRDRRYALTVLAESYRRDKKLEKLIERFAATPDLSAEARMTWIDLLREQGDAGKALALFEEAKADADGDELFTADMRRELLEICREAGRDDLLIKNFREMIAAEPRRLEWRSGLSRFYLERGERDKGQAVWADYQEQAERGDWLAAAGATMELGLDQLACSFAENMIRAGSDLEKLAALQFLFDLHKARGKEDELKAVLTRMDAVAAPDASERARLAESWEQIGRQDKAVAVLENLREARGPDDFSSDLETRLAWLYSETGAEEQAFETWKRVWLRIDSPGRRRYVEDRLMATASRLGKLADIAIELEEKLAEGTADKRDSALLVRLYTKVGDPVSASEIIHDFMKQSGGAEIQMLEEQARVYVMCNDYYHYERTLRKLMELDPEGSPEYFTQLAMSALERGRNDEARAILTEMRGLEENPASAEFEAGVLKIAGMHREAASAYWRGIAGHPDRIDAYLLLGRSLQTLGKGQQAIGLFQYLVENADADDLFTVAVDGLLNMNNPQQGLRLPPETLQWARRAILERLAGKDDKVYLFQLVSDVSEDLNDRDMMMRALAETLPIAGERRTTQLRELMELAKAGSRSRAPSASSGREDMLRFGRRLIGIGEVVPPQVYLDLGSRFLDDGDIRSAAKTFDKANDVLDYGGYRRKVASTFEQKRYVKSALRSYEKLLITEFNDVGLLVKIGELKEQLGRDEEANLAYRRALDVLSAGQPLFSLKEDKSNATGRRVYYVSRNVDRFDKYYLRVLTGFLASADPEDKACLSLVDDALEALKADLARAQQERETAGEMETLTLSRVPRIDRRSTLIRRLTLASGNPGKARVMEELLLEAFPADKTLLPQISRTWDSWGYNRRARDLVQSVPANPGRREAESVLGDAELNGTRKTFQRVLAGDSDGARVLLRDAEKLLNENWSSDEFNSLFAIARYLEDSAAVERLARTWINRASPEQKLWQCVYMLGRAFPSMDQEHRDRLAAFAVNTIQQQAQTSTNSPYYHYQYFEQLKRLTGRDIASPINAIRPKVNKLLALGGRYVGGIGSLFCVLRPEDYQILLRETYRKAKSSDRLAIIFSLVSQYPGKMDAALEETFVELFEEAALDNLADPLKIYQANTRRTYNNLGPNQNANAGLLARLLEKLAEGRPKKDQMGFLMEQAQAWNRAGDTQRGREAAGKAYSLALSEEKTDGNALALLRSFPPDYCEQFLAVLDKTAQENGESIELERKRILLLRQAGDPVRIMTALRNAIETYPQETSFRQELRAELEKLGLHVEAIEVLEALVELEPDSGKHRSDLHAAWTRLAHPIKARDALKKQTEPEPDTEARVKEPVGTETMFVALAGGRPVPAAAPSIPASPGTSTAAEGVGKSEAETQEKPREPPSTQLIKKHYEAGELDSARVILRGLWRRFDALDQASRSRYYRNPSVPHSNYFNWPTDKSSAVRETTPASPAAGLGGLKEFLVKQPLTSPYVQPTKPKQPTLFSAIGSETFVAEELESWLRTFDAGEYRGQLFDEILKELVKQRAAEHGVEKTVNDALAADANGELSLLDQQALIAALELYPEVGGEAAAAFLTNQLETLDPKDLWKAFRMARCFARRSDEDSALLLYHWCGANISYSRHFRSNTITALSLVDEIRKHLAGESRIRALDTVLPLMVPDGSRSDYRSYYHHFVLTTWMQELAPSDVYSHCPEICRQVVRDCGSTTKWHHGSLELATLLLAAGGDTEEALKGLQLILAPPDDIAYPHSGRRVYMTSSGQYHYSTAPGSSGSRGSRISDYLLQQWLPEDMTGWTDGDRWLSGIVERVGQWAADRKISTADAVRILSLAAVRQHQNHFDDSARATLAEIGKLSLTNPNDTIWFIDAAEIVGDQTLALDVASKLLQQRRLPIARVAALMEWAAKQQGVPAALELAEKASEYTWEPGFLQTMTKICQDAGDREHAQLWRDRYLQVLKLGPDSVSQDSEVLKPEKIPGKGVWVDPAIVEFARDQFRVTIWFEDQFLGDGEAYLRRTREFTGIGRTVLRQQVRETLKDLSNKSRKAAGENLDALVEAEKIHDLEYHWIVNGFTCRLNRENLDELKSVPGVRMIYFAGPALTVRGTPAADQSDPAMTPPGEFSVDQFESPWYVESLKADKVWKEHQITGKGVLNVIHDSNFVLSPNILVNRYRNPKEEPNGKDDCGNGLVDDLHGYDFLLMRPQLTRNPMPRRGNVSPRLFHGHQCVAIICGRGTKESPHRFGLAPESKWAGVLANQRIEAAVEWAIEQGADTYSMSFSRPNLREYRSHWRKIMEHGAFCGVHFVSGAGNFAVKGSPQYAPIPVQMRVPEDIPHVVFAAAGVQRDLSRTPFSSQGPVEWKTAHYQDGTVDKPEVGAFNFQLPLLVPNGKVVDKAASGNSYAGPMFCGTIALVLSANPDLNPWEVRRIIIDTATDVGPEGYDHQTGHGLIDAFAAVSEAIDRKR